VSANTEKVSILFAATMGIFAKWIGRAGVIFLGGRDASYKYKLNLAQISKDTAPLCLLPLAGA
jgi:hypothetical protein